MVKGLRIVVAMFFAVLLGLLPETGEAAPGDINTILSGEVAAKPLTLPQGVAVDSAGNLYIADTGQNRILKLAAGTGAVSIVAGNGTKAFSGDGDLATAAALNDPRAVAVDSAGDLYIADTNNRRIRKVAKATGIITTVAGNGTKSSTGDGGAATSATLNVVEGVAVDNAGNIYIADFFGAGIRKVDAGTGIITKVASSISAPDGVAVDSTGNLFVVASQSHRVYKVAAGTGVVSTVAGTGVVGFSGDNISATLATLALPSGITVDSAGNLYFSERHVSASRIRKVNAQTGIISTLAGTGTAGFSGDGGPAKNAQLNTPKGVAVDGTGNIYIADLSNNRIRKISAKIVPVVTATPAGATYSSAQNVVLSSNIPATIYYTIDGSEPNNVTSAKFTTTGQINISVSTTLKYFAAGPDGSSTVSTQEYNMVAGAPTGVSAIAATGQATVSFTPPSFNGGSDIIFYSVTSTPGGISAAGQASPIIVSGLTGGTAYTFTVVAVTNNGTGASAASNSVTPPASAYTLTLTFPGTGGGSVNDGMACTSGTTCAPVSFDQNAQVILTATPDADSLFSGWSSACTVSDKTCSITMSEDRSVAAYFTAVAKSRIVGGSSYSQLSAAYAAAAAGAVIQARAVEFNDGDLILNRDVAVTISGGYDTTFSSSNGQAAVKGKILVRDGTIRVDSVVVR